jgi:hypothetical protein
MPNPSLKTAAEIVGSRQIVDPSEADRIKREGVSEAWSSGARDLQPDPFELPAIPAGFTIDRPTAERARQLTQAIEQRGVKFNAQRIDAAIAQLEKRESEAHKNAKMNFGMELDQENFARSGFHTTSEAWRMPGDSRASGAILDWAKVARC